MSFAKVICTSLIPKKHTLLNNAQPVKIQSMNKYLEKIARFNGAITAVGDFAENVIGSKARKLTSEAEVLARHSALKNSPAKVQAMASDATSKTRDARIKTGLGLAAVGGSGFLGIHKYHQHKDRAIMNRLSQMYTEPQERQQ